MPQSRFVRIFNRNCLQPCKVLLLLCSMLLTAAAQGAVYLLDLGAPYLSTGNVTNLPDYTTYTLVDSAGNTGTATATLSNFTNGNSAGLNVASGDFPATILRDSFYVQGTKKGSLNFAGLQPNTAYTLTLIASRSGDDGGLGRHGRYTLSSSVSTDVGSLDASDNTQTLVLDGTAGPTGTLTLQLEIDPASQSRYAYLNGVKLETSGTGGSNTPPVAAITSSQVANTLSVNFTGAASTDADGSIASYAWNFGDSSTGSGVSPSHTYAAAGNYSVTLTVTDNQGATNALIKTVTVQPAGGGGGGAFWLLDLGAPYLSTGNVTNLPDYATYTLVDSAGNSGTATATLSNFSNGNSAGLNVASGDFPATILRDSFFVQGTKKGSLNFAGLQPNTAHTLTLIASRSGNDGGLGRHGRYTLTSSVSTDVGSLDASDNTQTLVLYGTTGPTGTLTLQLEIDPASQSNYAYLNGVKLETSGAGGGNTPPVAAFTSSQVANTLSVNFTGAASTDADGSIATYAWNFGDGSTGSGVSPSHTYAAAGNYTVTLTVTDNQGATNALLQTVNVQPAGGGGSVSWLLDLGAPYLSTGNVTNLPDYATYTLVDSTGNTGSVTAKLSNFTNGNSAGLNVASGDFPATILRDSFFVQGTKKGTLNFAGLQPNKAHTLTLIASRSGNDGGLGRHGRYTLTSSVSTDVGSLDASDNTQTLVLYGTTGPTGTLTLQLEIDPATQSNYAYLNGVKLETSSAGGSNTPPVAAFTSSQVANTLSVNFTGAASSDADGSIATYAWNFGDGATGSGVSPSHTYAAAGNYSVTLTVTDNQGATNALVKSVGVVASQNARIFLQEFYPDGKVVVEGELPVVTQAGSSGHAWQEQSDSKSSGDKVMRALPNTGTNITSNIEATAPRIDFSVNFTKAGDYYLWVRGTATDAASDTVHFGVDGVVQTTAKSISGFTTDGLLSWTNTRVGSASPVTLDIPSTGIHQISVWMAEDGFALDKFMLTNDPDFVPVGLGPSASAGGVLPVYPVTQGSHKLVWNFDEDPALGVATDSIDGQELTCSSCPTATQGAGDGAVSFASNRHMQLQNATLLNVASTQGFAVELLVKFTSACSSQQGMAGRAGGASAMRWALGCAAGKARAQLVDNGGNAGSVLVSTSSIDDGDWHHIALVRDRKFQETVLYVDGVAERRQSEVFGGSFSDTSAALSVGRADFGTGYSYLNGQVDSLAIHGRALRQDEIARGAQNVAQGLTKGLWGCEVPVKIMPLGDSITAGSNTPGTAIYGTYRTFLYDSLTASGYNVDFVGSATERHPESLDKNHEGWPGVSSYHIRNAVVGFLTMNTPDLILLHIGTNSLSSALGGTKASLDLINSFDTRIPVVVARIINKKVAIPETHAYNEALEAEVNSRIGTGDRLFLVDMETVLNPATDYIDDLHPTNAGAEKMALVWFDELIGILPRCRAAAAALMPAGTQVATAGTEFRFLPEVLGHPVGTFTLSNAPAGMTVNSETGEVRWIAPVAGNHSFTVSVTNASGADTNQYSLTVN